MTVAAGRPAPKTYPNIENEDETFDDASPACRLCHSYRGCRRACVHHHYRELRPGRRSGRRRGPNLHGNWDFLMDVGGRPSFGLLSIGFVDGAYGGSLTPVATAPVVVRKITLTGNTIHMVVASREGDVLFDGKLSAKADRMCGTVTYHGGQLFPMLVQRRPSTYQPQPQQGQ